MVEKILNNTTPYGKIRASHEDSLHSSTLILSPIKNVNREIVLQYIIGISSSAKTASENVLETIKYINFAGRLVIDRDKVSPIYIPCK